MKLLQSIGLGRPQVNKTETACIPPIAGCLRMAEHATDFAPQWHPVSIVQTEFLDRHYWPIQPHVDGLKELVSIANSDVSKVNSFLREHGFDIQLDALDSPHDIAVASIFKLLLAWIEPGRPTTVRDGRYPAVRISLNTAFTSSRHLPNPIVSIRTANGDFVHMSIMEHALDSGMALVDLVMRVDQSSRPSKADFGGVIFPMITCDQTVKVHWLEGMMLGSWRIAQALQQTKFRMNEFGAKVESATAMGMKLRYCADAPPPPPDLIIDEPFLLWITRPGLPVPLFVGHFTEEHWIRPTSL